MTICRQVKPSQHIISYSSRLGLLASGIEKKYQFCRLVIIINGNGARAGYRAYKQIYWLRLIDF